MNNQLLLDHENCWETTLGAWNRETGQVTYRGRNLFAELPNMRWLGLHMLGITGRILDDRTLDMLEAIWVIAISYPEPRLWINRVAAYAGTARSTGVLGVCSAVTTCEGTRIGHRVNIKTVEFFLSAARQVRAGMNVDDIVRKQMKEKRWIPGFGRPIKPPKDERIEPMMIVARRLGFAGGEHVRLAFQIEEALIRGRWRKNMNITGLAAAMAADMGLSPREYYHYLILGFSGGVMPCFVDALEKPEGAFFPMRCTSVQCAPTENKVW